MDEHSKNRVICAVSFMILLDFGRKLGNNGGQIVTSSGQKWGDFYQSLLFCLLYLNIKPINHVRSIQTKTIRSFLQCLALPESRTGGWKVHRRGECTKDEGMGRVVGDDAGREVVCGQVDYHLT